MVRTRPTRWILYLGLFAILTTGLTACGGGGGGGGNDAGATGVESNWDEMSWEDGTWQ